MTRAGVRGFRLKVGLFVSFLLFFGVTASAETLSGTVATSDGRPLAGVCVRATETVCGNAWAAEVQTDDQGAYALMLPPGTYFIIADAACGDHQNLGTLWWDDASGLQACEQAVGVSLPAGGDISNLHFSYPADTVGALAWSQPHSGPLSPAVGDDGTVYVGAGDGLHAYDPGGRELWNFTAGANARCSLGADGTIYAAVNSILYALNTDGSQRWSAAYGGSPAGYPSIGPDGAIYVSASAGRLYAFAPDGSPLWDAALSGLRSTAVGADGTIYAVVGSTLQALRADGTQRWSYPLGGTAYGAPAIDRDGTIYIGSTSNNLYAIRPDGTLKWRYDTGSWVMSSASLTADGTVLAGSIDGLTAIYPDGSLRWARTDMGGIEAAPAVGNDGTIYAGSWNGRLYALDGNGSEAWSYLTGASIYASPAVGSDGTVLVRSDAFYAIHSSSQGLAASAWPAFRHDNRNSGHQDTVYGASIFGTMTLSDGSPMVDACVRVTTSPCSGDWFAETRTDAAGTWEFVLPEGEYYIVTDANCGIYQNHPDLWLTTDGTVVDCNLAQPFSVLYGQDVVTTGFVFDQTLPGTLRWASPSDGGVNSIPAVDVDGRVYAGLTDGLHAFDADGNERWHLPERPNITPAVGGDGTLYCVGTGGYLNAVSPDGALLWQVPGFSTDYLPAIGLDGTIYAGRYVSSGADVLRAIHPDGSEKWSHNFQSLRGFVIGADGNLFVSGSETASNGVTALAPDGSVLWFYPTDGVVYSSLAVGADGTLYFGTLADKIYALNPDGTLAWEFLTGDSVYGTPVIGADGAIYCGAVDNLLYALNLDGTLRWTYDAGNDILGSPAIGSDGTLYLSAGTLQAISPDGVLLWSFTAGALPSSPVISDDGAVYFCADGVYAVNPNSPGAAGSAWPMALHDARHTGRNAVDVQRGSIAGRMLDFEGNPVANAVVQAFDACDEDPSATAITDRRGDYRIVGLAEGEHLLFADPSYYISQMSLPQWYTGAASLADCSRSEPVPVLAGARTSDVDFMLFSGGMLSGRVVDSGGAPLSGVCVKATAAACGESWQADGTTDESGVYRLTLPAGDYYLRTVAACESAQNLVDEWWNHGGGAVLCTEAEAVSVATGADTSDIDFALLPSATEMWGVSLGTAVIGSPARAGDGTLYVGSRSGSSGSADEDGSLFAVDPGGAIRWEFDIGSWVTGSPAVGLDGTVLVGANDGFLYAIRPDGSRRWAYQVGDTVSATPAIGSDGTVYITARLGTQGHLYAFRPDGTLKWDIVDDDFGGQSPVVGMDDTIYVPCTNIPSAHLLVAVNPSGTRKWVSQTGYDGTDGGVSLPAIAADGTIYFGSSQRFYALNRDGTLKWTHDESVRSAPVAGPQGAVYLTGADGTITALNPDGSLRGELGAHGVGGTNHLVLGQNGNIYLAYTTCGMSGCSGWLKSIDSAGQSLWTLEMGTGAGLQAIGQDGTLYLGTGTSGSHVSDGHLFAIATNAGGLAHSAWPMPHHDLQHTGRASAQPRTVLPLTAGQPHPAHISPLEFHYYALELEAGRPMVVRLQAAPGIEALFLDGGYGAIPLYGTGSQTTRTPTSRGYYELLIEAGQAGTYFLSVFGDAVAAAGADYTITADYLDGIYLSDISLHRAGNAGPATVSISGLGLAPGTTASLLGSGGQVLASTELVYNSFTELHATFDLLEATAGLYDIEIQDQEGNSSLLANGFEITEEETGGHLVVRTEAPDTIRNVRTYILWVEYENDGTADLPAPILLVSNEDGIQMRLSENEPFTTDAVQILAVNQDGPPDRLPPGSKFRIPVYFRFGGAGVMLDTEIRVEKMVTDGTAVDWSAMEDQIRSEEIDPQAWPIVWSNFTAQMGSTWSDYARTLRRSSVYLERYRSSLKSAAIGAGVAPEPYLDSDLYNVGSLIAFEFAKANAGISARSVLASGVDLSIPAPGFPLTLGRFLPQSISARLQSGVLGRGWCHSYDYSLEVGVLNTIHINGPGGSVRTFLGGLDGRYHESGGGAGTVSNDSGDYVLTEKSGIAWRFTNNRLASIEDLNGNHLSFSYAGDLLSRIDHANGDWIAVDHNADSRIAAVSDSTGRTIQYRYDATGAFLVEVEKPGGVITRFSYHEDDGSAAAGALTRITFPDGSHYYYAYDEKGRLAAEYEDGDVGHLAYGYDSQGTITLTDAAGAVSTLRLGIGGEMLEVTNALGFSALSSLDDQSRTTRILGPDGNPAFVGYDGKSSVLATRNALGHAIRLSYQTDSNRLARLTDARENVTTFEYDSSGNLDGITYPDLSRESYSYDASGSLTAYTNRRSETIQYTVDTRGQVTRKVYPDGRTMDYIYDVRGNLISANDTLTGEIVMSYDTRNFLTAITYPGGYGFTYEYDDAGNRTRRTSHDGYILNYTYDATGRLEEITEGVEASLIVRYGYDQNGRLIDEFKGNGTSTSYTYDPAGQLTSLVNYSPEGAVQSRFDYTYDENGNRTSMTTLEGTTDYAYDDIGQLVHVVYPDGGEEVYEYDEAGNRIRTEIDGVVTEYETNEMNQYTRVGDTTYAYDDDGNLIAKTDSSGNSLFFYNSQNQMIRMETATEGDIEYIYDALGNRFSSFKDGSTVRYLYDTDKMISIVATYNDENNFINRYAFGHGLVKTNNFISGIGYYSFDGIGNTCHLTDNFGTIINNYEYTPFGLKSLSNETFQNDLCFLGRYGVQEDSGNLYFTRWRFYNCHIGRFTSEDPIGFKGGLNPYRYALNNPNGFYDADGKKSVKYKTIPKIVNTNSADLDIIGQLKDHFDRKIELERFHEIHSEFYKAQSETPKGEEKEWIIVVNGEIDPIPKDEGVLIDNNTEAIPIKVTGTKLSEKEEAALRLLFLQSYTNPDSDIILLELAKEGPIEVTAPSDPNEKLSIKGIGDQHFITDGEVLNYTIFFENKPEATAPAQEVFVDDFLDADLDWSTFRLGEVSFGDRVVSALAGRQNGQEQVVLDDLAVDIAAQIDPATGHVQWVLRSLDLETGELPYDALAGFLPPNDETGRGEGYVTFSIEPRNGLDRGTVITNQAEIVFDTEAPILTNTVFNTITDDPPTGVLSPSVPDGAVDVPVSQIFGWSAIQYAAGYDLYLWRQYETRPESPTAAGLTSPFYEPSHLDYNTTYTWQVVARNVMGELQGPVWSFATAEITLYTLAGRVTRFDHTGIQGVTVTGLPGPPVTAADGSYAASLPFEWTGTVMPQAGELVFDPPGRTYGNINADLADQNFIVPDFDGDGMPDQWEMDHFGTVDRGGTGDFDGDGISDLDEYLAGTNPARMTSVHLESGFNLIAIPMDVSSQPDLRDWLPLLGTADDIERVMVYDAVNNRFVTLIPEAAENPEFLLGGGEGLIVYVGRTFDIPFNSVDCTPVNLNQGFNLVGFACPPDGYTAYGILAALGGNTVAQSIQRFNPATGTFETAAYDPSGQIGGADFPIANGEGYILHMRQAAPGFLLH